MAHFTIKPAEKKTKPSIDADASDELAGKLRTHLATTFKITLEKRVGTKWEPLECAAEIDVLTPDETEVEATPDTRVSELVDAMIEAVESESGIDGPLRVRVQGWPERGRRELWTHTWKAGGVPTSGELKTEREEAGTATIGTLCMAIDRLSRHLDRSHGRTQSVQDASVANVTKILESLGALIKQQQEVAAPMVELEKLKIVEREKALEATLSFEQEKNSMAMFMEAIGLIGKAVMAERRDKRRDERARKAAADEPIDVDATSADERTDVGARPNGKPSSAGSSSSTSTSSSSSSSSAMVVHGERFEDAEDLAEILEDLEDDDRRKLQALLTSREWGTVLSASEAKDQISYDARFNDFYDAYTLRSPEEAGRLFAEISGVIGMSGAAVLGSLIQNFEKRQGVTVAGG